MNLSEIKADLSIESEKLERKFGIIDLINRAIQKRDVLSNSSYYSIYGTTKEQIQDLAKMDYVISRLVEYLKKQ